MNTNKTKPKTKAKTVCEAWIIKIWSEKAKVALYLNTRDGMYWPKVEKATHYTTKAGAERVVKRTGGTVALIRWFKED